MIFELDNFKAPVQFCYWWNLKISGLNWLISHKERCLLVPTIIYKACRYSHFFITKKLKRISITSLTRFPSLSFKTFVKNESAFSTYLYIPSQLLLNCNRVDSLFLHSVSPHLHSISTSMKKL